MNDNQENQQNETKQLTLAERVQAEYDNNKGRFHGSAYAQPDNRHKGMSEEELKNALETERRTYELKYATERFFANWINNRASPMHLLMAPNQLSFDHILRSNTAMVIILKSGEGVTGEDFTSIISEIDSNAPLHIDNARLVRFISQQYSGNTTSLAECYWLLQLATFLGCAQPSFVSHMFQILNKDTKLEELNFQRPLVQGSSDEVQLKVAAIDQYQHIEALLKRIS